MIKFSGYKRGNGEAIVLVNDGGGYSANLPVYFEEAGFSQSFSWGNVGSGSLQLAYAILRFYGEQALKLDEEQAKELASGECNDFMVDVISELPTLHSWEITEKKIDRWLVDTSLDKE